MRRNINRFIDELSFPVDALNTRFIRHYFFAGGRPFGLVRAGLLDDVRRAPQMRAQTIGFQRRVFDRMVVQAKRLCAGSADGHVASLRVSGNHRKHIDFRTVNKIDTRLFSLGGADIIMSAAGEAEIICRGRKSGAIYDVDFTYEVDDWFIDAADFRNNIPGNQEFRGGRPFELVGLWTINRRGRTRL